MRKAPMLILIALVLVLVWLPATSDAHSGDQSYLYLEITDEVHAELHMPYNDIEEHLGVAIEGSDEEIERILAVNESLLLDYAADHFEFRSGEIWEAQSVSLTPLENNDYVVARFKLDVQASAVPADFELSLDPFFDENSDRDALFLISNDWERGFVGNEADPIARFTATNRDQGVDIGDRSWVKNFTSSVGLGVDHIKTGPDHVLFVAVLLLPAVLAWSTRWEPVESFRRSLWRVLKVVSMFTLAHSITFTLAGLSVIPLPSSRIVETVIALSIAAAAWHNLRPIAPQREWLLAFSFGLFHGLGFASLIEDLQISRSTQLVSLLGRNLGIEIGQAAVVLAVFPGLFLLRRTKYYMPLFRICSIVLIVVSLGWVAERLFDARQVASAAVNVVISWPRVVWVVAAFTVVAIGIRHRERDRLLPVLVTSGDADAPASVIAAEQASE